VLIRSAKNSLSLLANGRMQGDPVSNSALVELRN